MNTNFSIDTFHFASLSLTVEFDMQFRLAFFINIHLLFSVWILVRKVNSQNCHENEKYKNLYGCKEFDVPEMDYDLIYGTLKTIGLADQFANAAQPDITPRNHSAYNFIIIGAGSAGSIIASRLSEVKSVSVLLIEAGEEEVYNMGIPLLMSLVRRNESLSTFYPTKRSDKFCRGNPNEQCYWPTGRVMGGTSTINQMIVTRGHPEDYNEWERSGNHGWSYEDVLPYFKKLEKMLIPEYAKDDKYHGTNGPITVSFPSYHTPLAEAFMKAGEEMGYPKVDYNTENTIGFSYLQTSTVNGSRMSSNRAYLHSRLRENLHVTKNSFVTKILFNENKRAIGVQYVKNGKQYTVHVLNEVIVSAGAIGSPKLLMLSGIGPAKHLQSLGIQVVKDAPVGENLQDHVGYMGVIHTVDQPVSLSKHELFSPGKPYFTDYLMKQTGPFTIVGGSECLFYSNTLEPRNLNAVPNMEQIFFTSSLGADSPIISIKGMHEPVVQAFAPLKDTHSWSTIQVVQKPKSRGYLRLQSANPYDLPEIVPKYFDHPDDMKILITGIRQAIEIGQTKAMKRFNSTLFHPDLPACRQFLFNSDEYYDCAARQVTVTAYHLCGTCKMGPENDPTAVVNPELQVIGVKGLRVADASIIPEIPAAHTNIPVYMIAEKLSDMIKTSWRLPIN